MREHHIRWSLLSVVVFCLLATGCSQASQAAPAESPRGSASRIPGPQWLSPLDQFLDSDPLVAKARHINAVETQTYIAECMKVEGQKYLPFYPPVDDTPVDEPLSLPDARQNGYGLTIAASTPGLDDPNIELYESLTPAQQKNWNRSLGGTPDDQSAGCLGEAERQVGSPLWSKDILARPEFSTFGIALTTLQDQIGEHPRLVEVRSGWSECMATAGFDGLNMPGSAWNDVLNRGADALGVDHEKYGLDTGAFATLPEATLANLQQYERSIAVADYTCSEPIKTVEREVQVALETEFIDLHRADLVRLRSLLRNQ